MLKYLHRKSLINEVFTVESTIVKAFSQRRTRPKKIFFYKSTDSTNERARHYPDDKTFDFEITESGFAAELFIANAQSAGRGRIGRKFISNDGAGLYMSLRFHFPLDVSESVGITPLAAVAVCRALKKLCGAHPEIKWVNDVYMNGKKLAGILTESTLDQTGRRVFICGIGINLLPSDMPSELDSIATNLKELGFTPDRFELASAITEEILENLENPFAKKIVDEYKSLSFLIGRKVKVIAADGESTATVSGITDRYELRVCFDDGREENLSTGEVSIKL